MAAKKLSVIYDGEAYFSLSATAKLLGTNTSKLRAIIIQEGLIWRNFRVNGPLMISETSINGYLIRQKLKDEDGPRAKR